MRLSESCDDSSLAAGYPFELMDRGRKKGTGTVAATLRLLHHRFAPRSQSSFSEKRDGHRGRNASIAASPLCATEPVPIFPHFPKKGTGTVAATLRLLHCRFAPRSQSPFSLIFRKRGQAPWPQRFYCCITALRHGASPHFPRTHRCSIKCPACKCANQVRPHCKDGDTRRSISARAGEKISGQRGRRQKFPALRNRRLVGQFSVWYK